MMIKRTYSLVDIAQKLKRPRTTLADWSTQFREFIPTIGSGRTMRYTEEALEVFALISRMKDVNEPPEMIRTQLLENFRVITIQPAAEDEETGKQPYLVQLAGDVDDLKRAVVMLSEQIQALTTENDGVRREVTATAEKLSGRIADVSDSLRDEMRKGQQETNAQLGEILSRVDTYGKRKWFWPFG